MLTIDSATRLFETPRVLFTLLGNPLSEVALETSLQWLTEHGVEDVEVKVFPDGDAVREFFEGGISPLTAVALFDATTGADTTRRGRGKRYRHLARSRPDDDRLIPAWTMGAQWAVIVYRPHGSIGHQVAAQYVGRFTGQLKRHQFPWGEPRKGEQVLGQVDLPDMTKILARLNDGPDLASNIANNGHRDSLPTGSRISWLRVPSEPVTCDLAILEQVTQALGNFEVACSRLLRQHPGLREQVLAGVTLPRDVQELYLTAPAERFSVTRPDLHYVGGQGFESVSASEVDEMPGGFPELAHLDNAYGINQERWAQTYDWLTEEGRLVFLVSSEWSRCYYEETGWLVRHMRGLGYDVHMVTTDDLSDLTISDGHLYHDNVPVGTVWRLFPVFECSGFLVDLVRLSHEGGVRLVPEFAPWGNKVWFSVARTHEQEFRAILSGMDVNWDIIRSVLPDSRLVLGSQSFPVTVGGIVLRSLEALRQLRQEDRDRLVLKMAGANTMTARSYGVLMGRGLTPDTWVGWINERTALGQPFIIQSRFTTAVTHLPVHHTGRANAELFPCRVLMRPWTVGGRLVSVHGCAVPSNTERVHGMVDMAVVPFSLS